MFNSTIEQAQATFADVRSTLIPYNGTELFISESYVSYPDYWTFYWNESGVEPPVGSASALGSRLFDRDSVQSNSTMLRDTIETLAGTPGQFTFNAVELVSGGQIFTDALDPFRGLLPAWRVAYFNNIVSRGWPASANETVRGDVWNDITNVKVASMKRLAPNTGAYMNEADRHDTDFEADFYGENYDRLRAIKATYDPDDLFYCPTCVGSSEWNVQDDRTLCHV